MKRSWLIGAALVLSLSAFGCGDDDEDTDGGKTDAGDAGPGVIDGGVKDASMDAKTNPGDAGDAG